MYYPQPNFGSKDKYGTWGIIPVSPAE